jgi:hypothetical protein
MYVGRQVNSYLNRLIQKLLQHLRAENDFGPYKIQAAHGIRDLVIAGTAIAPSGKLRVLQLVIINI